MAKSEKKKRIGVSKKNKTNQNKRMKLIQNNLKVLKEIKNEK
jgi:hypothetical protein